MLAYSRRLSQRRVSLIAGFSLNWRSGISKAEQTPAFRETPGLRSFKVVKELTRTPGETEREGNDRRERGRGLKARCRHGLHGI